MLIYILILVFILLVSLIDSKKINKLDILFFIFLAAISGFRYGVGTDFFSYVRYFNLIDSGNKAPTEVGFNYLGILISNLGLNSQALFLTISVLTILFLYKGIRYYTDSDYIYKPVLYIVFIIFTFFPSLNGIRQALAAAIVFYASKYIIEKSFTKFSIWIIIASLFHFSSIFFFIIYFFGKRNYKKSSLLIGLFISIVIANFGFINEALEYILINFSFLDIGGYIGNLLYSPYNSREISFGIVFYINLFLLVLFIFLKDRLLNNDKSIMSFNFFYLYILTYVLSMDASMLTRVTYYFSIYMALTIPRFGILFESKSKRIVEFSICCLYSMLFLYVIINGYLNPGQSDLFPYDYNFNLFN